MPVVEEKKYPKFGNISYALTTATFAETDDLEAGIKKEFPDGTLGDFRDLETAESTTGRLKAFLDEIGLKRTEEAHCHLSGSRIYYDNRSYLLCRWDGNVRSGWLAHEGMNNDTLCLGSWYGLNLRALVAFKN